MLVDQVVVHQVLLNSHLTSTPLVLLPTMPHLVLPQPLVPHSREEGSLATLMFNSQLPAHLGSPHLLLHHPTLIPLPLVPSMVHSLNRYHLISILHLIQQVVLLLTLHPVSSSRRHPILPQDLHPIISRTVLLVVAPWPTNHPTPTRTILTTTVLATLQVATPTLHPTPPPHPTHSLHFPLAKHLCLLAQALVPQS